jgi:hypothetical protein
VDGVGGAKKTRLEEDKLANDGGKMQVQGFVELLLREWWNDTINRLSFSGLGPITEGWC